MSDDFQKLFKQQLTSAIITDESKKRMQRVQGEGDETGEQGQDTPQAPDKGKAPAKKKTAKASPKGGKKDSAPSKKAGPAKKKTPKKKATAKKAPEKVETKEVTSKEVPPKEASPQKAPPKEAPLKEAPLKEAETEAPAKSSAQITIDLDSPLPEEVPPEQETAPKPDASIKAAAAASPETPAKTIAIDLDTPPEQAKPESEAPIEPAPQEQSKAETPAKAADKASEKRGTDAPSAKAARDKGPEAIHEFSEDDGVEDLEHRFLTFHIGEEIYGVEISYVTEIIGMQVITEVPDMPVFIKGVINLRGEVIPVVEVRSRFGMEIREYDDRTCVVVVRLEDVAVGLVVDTVSEVLDIPSANISPPPNVGNVAKSRFIRAMGRVGEEVRILLDLKTFLYDGYMQD